MISTVGKFEKIFLWLQKLRLYKLGYLQFLFFSSWIVINTHITREHNNIKLAPGITWANLATSDQDNFYNCLPKNFPEPKKSSSFNQQSELSNSILSLPDSLMLATVSLFNEIVFNFHCF